MALDWLTFVFRVIIQSGVCQLVLSSMSQKVTGFFVGGLRNGAFEKKSSLISTSVMGEEQYSVCPVILRNKNIEIGFEG